MRCVMRFAKFFPIIISVIMLLCLHCSCSKGESDLKFHISSSDKTLIDLALTTYDESQLLEIIEFDGTINELNVQYPVECIRDVGDLYRVSYLGCDCVAIILFNNSGNKILGKLYSAQRSKSDFSDLQKGQSLEKVREIDPNGEYLFLYSGRNDAPRVSSHYTNDGYFITIEYDDLNAIVRITQDLI